VNATSISYTNEAIPDSVTVVIGKEKFYFRTEKKLDTTTQKESLLKELEYYKGFLIAVDKKLSNERFVQNAKPDVVELEKKKREDAEQKIKIIEESLRNIE
jgi:valyl-tRNA synthetase